MSRVSNIRGILLLNSAQWSGATRPGISVLGAMFCCLQVVPTKSYQLMNQKGEFSGVKGRLTIRVEEEGDAFSNQVG